MNEQNKISEQDLELVSGGSSTDDSLVWHVCEDCGHKWQASDREIYCPKCGSGWTHVGRVYSDGYVE